MSTEESNDTTFTAHMLQENPDLVQQEIKMKQTYKLFLFMSGFIVVLALVLLISDAPTPFYFLLLPQILLVALLYFRFKKRQRQAAWIRASISELHEVPTK